MLYTSGMMNDKPFLPESVMPGRNYSFRADCKLNAWAFVAALMAAFSRAWIHHHPEWSAPMRTGLALSPLLPSFFYARSVARWIRGMDEMQRRIQLEACLFATVGTIFVVTGMDLLHSNGIHLSPPLQNGPGWEGTFALVVLFFIAGNLVINRRYR